MKNSVKRLAAAVLALAMVSPCALTACNTDIIDEYELSAYKGVLPLNSPPFISK